MEQRQKKRRGRDGLSGAAIASGVLLSAGEPATPLLCFGLLYPLPSVAAREGFRSSRRFEDWWENGSGHGPETRQDALQE